MYGLQGDWTKAKPILERQYKEAPGNVLILKAYAYSLAATGDEARACEMYKKLYDEDSENPEAALNYARILFLAKRYDETLSFIEELKTRFTESAENKAIAELEEKIKKAREEPEKQEKEAQDKNGKTQDKSGKVQATSNTADGTENRTESAPSNSKTEQGAVKPAADREKDKKPQTKLPADTGNDKGVTAKPAPVNSAKSAADAEPAAVKKKDGTKK